MRRPPLAILLLLAPFLLVWAPHGAAAAQENAAHPVDVVKVDGVIDRPVADYLVGQGIDPSRIESAGYGDNRPVAPNLTARGRELNRRVEFLILEK